MWASGARHIRPAMAGALSGLAGIGGLKHSGFNGYTHCHESEASFSKAEFRSFPVMEVREAGLGSKILKCQLPSSEHVMGMKVSSMVMVNGTQGDDGKVPARPYTPISTDDQKGYFELLVKGYPTGTVSKYLCSLKAGDSVEVKGPFPKLPYSANMKKEIGMIAGGSGITPMLQVIREILKNPADTTQVTLVFCNQTSSDILLRTELDQLAVASKGQLRVLYVVDKNENSDPHIAHVGYATQGFLSTVLPAPSPDTLVYVCGPPPMLVSVAGNKKFEKGKPPAQGEVGGILKELDYSADMVFKF